MTVNRFRAPLRALRFVLGMPARPGRIRVPPVLVDHTPTRSAFGLDRAGPTTPAPRPNKMLRAGLMVGLRDPDLASTCAELLAEQDDARPSSRRGQRIGAVIVAGLLGWQAPAFAQEASPAPPAADEAAEASSLIAVHGQATVVSQGVPGFASPYQGASSLAAHQVKETTDVTPYIALDPWRGGEVWVNPEMDQGFGLSSTLGVADFPSAEAYKVGRANPYFRLQRAFFRQTLGLGGGSEAVDDVGDNNTLRAVNETDGEGNSLEYGSVKTKAGLDALLAVDVTRHVRASVAYPAVMLTTGYNDPRVAPFQPGKIAAHLQAAQVPGGRPILLRVDFDAGHGIGSTPGQRERELADKLGLLYWQIGEPAYQPQH